MSTGEHEGPAMDPGGSPGPSASRVSVARDSADRTGAFARALVLAGKVLQRIPRVVAAMLAVGWVLLIWNLSAEPQLRKGETSGILPVLHNFAHAPAYGVLALLAALTLPRRAGWAVTDRAPLVLAWSVTVAYGIVDEVHQSLVPYRDASVFDVLTDAIGALLVLLVVRFTAGPHADESKLKRTFGWGLLACAACALLATAATRVFATPAPA